MDLTLLLPGEILNMAVVLVCHRWKDEGEDPRLWDWIDEIRVTPANLSMIPAVLGWRRLQAARSDRGVGGVGGAAGGRGGDGGGQGDAF